LTTAANCDNGQGGYMGKAYNMYYGYNLASDLTSFIYPSGRVILTSYDTANRISQVQDVYNGNTSTHAGSINYWPNRVIENMNIGHQNSNNVNLVENTTLNSRLQVSARNAQFGSTFPVQFSFTYGASGQNNGNLTAQQIQTIAAPNPPPGVTIPALNLTQNYTYDAYDRILSATETGGTSEWTQNYLYDQWGNRAVQTGSYIPNPNGTPTAITQFTNNQWLGTGASYDAAGDATGVPGSTNETFTYDAENRVNTANANGTITYIYDGQGRRVEKTSSTFSTIYLYDAAGKAIVETTVPVTGTSFPTDAPVTGTEYLIEDHLGSTRLSMNNQGQVVRRYDFLPFGEEIVAGVGGRGADYEPSNYVYPTTPDDVLHKFTSKERDSETGLDFFGARYFSSAEGRFTSPDWAAKPQAGPYADFGDPQTLNLYGYVRNNPMGKGDPDGHGPDILVIEDGPTEGNPIGHTAIAVTGQGVFSFGNGTKLGSSTTDYLARETGRRDQTVTAIKTTPERDHAAVEALMKEDAKGGITKVQDNCASRSNAALDAAGIPRGDISNPMTPISTPDPSLPGTAGARAQATPGSQTTTIPKGSTSIPAGLNQFNPGPNQNTQLPKPETKTPNGNSSS
jgi:RHS repeat-associated protein